MFNSLVLLVVVFLVVLVMAFTPKFLTLKTKNKIKMNPFECGSSSMKVTRQPFSSQFFMLGLIFIMFDIEILLLFNLLSGIIPFFLLKWTLFFTLLVTFMVLTLILEWESNNLTWFL